MKNWQSYCHPFADPMTKIIPYSNLEHYPVYKSLISIHFYQNQSRCEQWKNNSKLLGHNT